MKYIDKMPYKSKKFLAMIGVQIVYSTVLIFLFYTQTITLSVALVAGIVALAMSIVAVGYISGQAAVDKLIAGVGHIASFGRDRGDQEEYPSEEEEEDGAG